MQIKVDYGAEPVRSDTRLLLMLVALTPVGLLIWAGLFFAIEWSLVAVWALAVAVV